MMDKLQAVEDILSEHSVMRHYAESIGKLIRDQEDLLLGRRNGKPDGTLAERRFDTGQSLAYFRDGSKGHVRREIEALQPIVGDAVIAGINAEHAEAYEQLSRVEALLMAPGLEEGSPEELARWSYEIRRAYEELMKIANGHWVKEEALVELVKKGMYRLASEGARQAA
ncbi:MAG: hypothetical protein HYX92_10205 [Chloroflexi bacterium]|nr:hypothetical protein [Chloroflexota bacterium]